jgi:hypothetical protein
VVRAALAEQSFPQARTEVIALLVEAQVRHRDQRPIRIDDMNSEAIDRVRPSAALGACRRGCGRATRDLLSQLRERIVEPFVSEIDGHLETSSGHAANGLRASKDSADEAHPRVDLIDAHDEAAVAASHLNADELDTAQGEMRLVNSRVHAKAIADELGGARPGARCAPHPKADHEHQGDQGRDHPCAPLAEEPQHRGEIMPRLKPEA